MIEPEILIARRALPDAQRLLPDAVVKLASPRSDASWHDVGLDPERGCFALVRRGGPLEDLAGEIVRVAEAGGRSVRVYVLAARDIPAGDLSLARRAFLALAPLNVRLLPVSVEVVA